MELVLRVVVAEGPTHDVRVCADPTHTVGELTAALADFVGLGSTAGRVLRPEGAVSAIDPELVLSASGILSGSTVVLSPSSMGLVETSEGADGATAEDSTTRLVVDIVGGPDTGRSFRITAPGAHTVGREVTAAVRLVDPSVSRRHAVLDVDASGVVTIRVEPTAVNGSSVGGVDLVGPTTLTGDDVVRLGGTRLVVREVDVRRQSAEAGRCTGVLDVLPGPYRVPTFEAPDVEPFGPVPDRPEPRRPPVVSIVAPLVLGLVMYAVFRHLQFLLLVVVSPLLLLASVVEDRRSGRREMRHRVARFEAELEEYRRRLGAVGEAERRHRHAAAPDLADLARRAAARSSTLWQRRSTSSDALVVRVGVGRSGVARPAAVASGGASDLRARAVEAVALFDELDDVPITVDLRQQEVVAVTGPSVEVDGLVRALLVQVATLRSPSEVVIAAALDGSGRFDWLDWLPHVRSPGSPDSAGWIVRSSEHVPGLFERVAERGSGRAETEGPSSVVLVVDGSLGIDSGLSAEFLDRAPGRRLSVVWLAADGGEVPRQARTVISTGRGGAGDRRGASWSVEHGEDDRFEPEALGVDVADEVARSVAPLRDGSAVGRSAVVRTGVDLFELLGVGDASPSGLGSWILDRWSNRSSPRSSGLSFPVGLAAEGPVVIDLVGDGPHALVAGTSGSGKSEFLRTLVLSLAVHHPPDRVNVLFVDFKGGATSEMLGSIPHCVGTVSNLTPGLARRVLVSLRAELERRMAALQGLAPDLESLRRSDPDLAPPALVVVVDEFATLVSEIPEFVRGMVDIAQRGRSLGIHLVLATQRPSGSVTDDILANTALRIGLRMLDPVESSTVLGSPVAATLRGRGRAVVQRSGGRPVEFQVAHSGALVGEGPRRVVVHPLHGVIPSPVARLDDGAGAGGDTQSGRLVTAVGDTAGRLDLPPPFRPWCDALPTSVDLDGLVADARCACPDGHTADRSGWPVVVGLLDEPERQRQRPAVVDLDLGVVLVGGLGAGATTFVRTVAAAVEAGPVEGEVLVIDGRSCGLMDLVGAPGVVDVVPGSDVEALTRWIVTSEDEIARRRRSMDAEGRWTGRRVAVVVHGFDGVVGALVDGRRRGTFGSSAETWVDRLLRVVLDGRAVGFTAIVTTARRGELPSRVEAALSTRIVLRSDDPTGWVVGDLPGWSGEDSVAGRGVLVGRDGGPVLLQLAIATGSIAGSSAPRHPPFLRSRRLPDRVPGPRSEAGTASWSDPVLLGVADVSGDPVFVDVGRSDLVIVGPPGSGRSTALEVLAAQLDARVGRSGDGSSRLQDGVRILSSDGAVRVVFVDDAGRFDAGQSGVEQSGVEQFGVEYFGVEHGADADLEWRASVVGSTRSRDVRLIAAVDRRVLSGFATGPFAHRIRSCRQLLVLQPDDPTEFLQATGVRWPIRPGSTLPPGRGVLVVDHEPIVVQVFCSPPGALETSVQSDR